VVRSIKVSWLDIVGYNWDWRNLWKHRCCWHFRCALNVVPGLLHVTFCGGGARIEVVKNQIFRHVGATVDKSLACCF
jgi:hypothetical protein